MGMTIDEAIDFLVESKYSYESPSSDTLDVAISTMHKYQRIKQIVNAELEEYHPLDRNTYRLALIKEVLEDGN